MEDAENDPTLIQIEVEEPASAVELPPPAPTKPPAVEPKPELTTEPLRASGMRPPVLSPKTTAPRPVSVSRTAASPTVPPRKSELHFDVPPLSDENNIALPPPEAPKPKRPSPALIDEVLRRMATAKAEKGVTGPSGDAVGRAEAVVAACEAEISPNTEKARAARLHFDMAQSYELFIDDESKALLHYQKSVDLAPEFLPAVRGTRRLLTAQKSFPAALKLLDMEIDLEGDAKYKALLHCVKGRIFEDDLHQQTKARQSYQKALELFPGSPEVMEALKQVEQKAKNWPGLAELLQQTADAVSGDQRYRAAVIAERARLLDTRTKNAAAATETYAFALRLNPDAQGVTGPLKRLLYTQSRWQELIALWERDIARSGDAVMQSSALMHVSRLYADHLGDRAKAGETLERAHRVHPSSVLVLELLVDHYEYVADPEHLIDALKRLSAVVPEGDQRLAPYHRIAELYETQLGDAAQAVSWYEAALKIFPAYIPALRAVTGLYERLGRWEALVAMHLGEASSTDDSNRRAEAHVRAAEIFEYRLGRPHDAAQHHALASALVPGLESSFKAQVRLLAEARQYKPLIDLYETAVENAADEDLAVTYLFKIGFIYEDALMRPDLAVDVYRRIQRRSLKNLGAIHAIQRTAEASFKFADLFDALRMEAEVVKEPKRHVELLQAAARTADEKLQDLDTALLWYKKVLEADAAYPPALAGIGTVYRKLERWSDLLDIYGRELKAAESKEIKIGLLTKMAELCAFQIGDDAAAVKYYRQAVEFAPTNQLLIHALCRRLERTGNFDMLAAVLQNEIGNMEDATEKSRNAVRLAEIHEHNRKDLLQAAASYHQALEARPGYRPALDGLARVNAALGHWSDLAEQLIKDAEVSYDPSVAVEDLLQAGGILSDQLNDTKRAVSTFEGVLAKDNTNLAALMALSPLLRETGAWQKLIEVHVRLAAGLTDAGEKMSVLKELARLIEANGEPAELRRVLTAALTIDPRDPTVISRMEKLAAAKKDWALSAEADLHSAASATVPELAAVYLARMGQALETTAPAEAVEAYVAANAFDPDGLAALRGMAYLGEKTGNPDTQIQALRKEADWTQSGKNSADLLVRCADIRLRLQRDFQGAATDLTTALYRHPEHSEAAERITSLLTQADQLETLIEILSRAAEMTRDGNKKAEYWGTVAKLRAEGRNDIAGAVFALTRMLSAQPNHVPSMLQLAALYKQNRQWDEAAKILERAVKQRPLRKTAIEIHLELARLAGERLSNTAMALANIDALLQLDPTNIEALTLLCDAQFKSGNLDAAAGAAEKLLKAAESADARASALFCMARVRFRKNAKKSAAKSFREAVALAGPSRMAAPEYLSMLGSDETWEEYLGALVEYQKAVFAAPGNEAEAVAVAAEIARVQHEGLGRPAEAVAVLERAVSEMGDSPTLRFELAKRLAAANQLGRAAHELRRLTAEQPLQVEPWQLLVRVYRADGKDGEAAVASAPLSIIGGGSEGQGHAEPLFMRPGAAETGAFRRPSLVEITPRVPGVEALTGLLAALMDALSKVYAPNFEQFGISSREKLADSHPLHLLTNLLAQSFGLAGHDLYISPTAVDVAVELTDPVSIIVPMRLNKAEQTTQVFALSRVFAYIARDQHAILRMGFKETSLTIAAVTQKFSSALGASFDGESLDRQAKRISKAVSWRARKNVDEAAALLASTPGLDPVQVLRAIESGAMRAGALLSGDLSAVMAQMDEILRDPEVLSSMMENLLSFWASDSAFKVRRDAKLI